METNIKSILKTYWGFDSFRPLQEDIINAILNKKDTLALLPTGGGKSICFQIPALASEGICVVVSPLIALMKDQVQQLEKREVKAAAIFSGISSREIDLILDNCVYGQTKLLYVSPERLLTKIFIERFQKMNVSFLAIDEAHCISQWGYDFRPPYLKINELRAIKPDLPIIALTASATERVKADIIDKLQFKEDHKIFTKSFSRKNLFYNVRYEEGKYPRILKILNKMQGSAIVYMRSRRKTEDLAGFLLQQNISADFYHAGLPASLRNTKQQNWIENWCRVMVATNAFGMGIDKPDVRLVAHLDLPDSLEAYYQEAGRGGRDGLNSYAITLYNKNDVGNLKRHLTLSKVTPEIAKKIYQAIGNHFDLAIGSGKNQTFDFDIYDFCNSFQLNALQAYNSIKLLSDEGYLSANDAFFIPSRIFVRAKKHVLEKFEKEKPQQGILLKHLLRRFEGILDQYVQINEVKVARTLKIKETNLVDQLLHLRKKKIIDYQPKTDKPRLTFLEERLPVENLKFDTQKIEQLFTVRSNNINAVLAFIKNQAVCRNRIILNYFNEQSENNCGACDVCRDVLNTQKKIPQQEDIKMAIIKLLATKPFNLNEITESLKFNATTVSQTLELMLDNKELERDQQFNFMIKQS